MLTCLQVVQQRQAQMELEEHRRQLHEVTVSRKQLQESVADLQDRLDAESNARNEEASAKRQLQLRLQELEISASTSTSMTGGKSEFGGRMHCDDL
jgi:myosin heavy chain 9/10/11/14